MLCDRCNTPFQTPFGPVIGKQSPLTPEGIADILRQRPGQIVALPPLQMTGDQFVIWLRGYVASTGAQNLMAGDWKAIIAKLDTLGGPK